MFINRIEIRRNDRLSAQRGPVTMIYTISQLDLNFAHQVLVNQSPNSSFKYNKPMKFDYLHLPPCPKYTLYRGLQTKKANFSNMKIPSSEDDSKIYT